MSKVAERIVVEKLVSHLQEHDLLPRLQSAYRRHHSTETALLRVLSDIYTAADRQDVTLLGLLDLSAAFDCVDHDILARRLQQSFGICGKALAWLQLFLHGRTQQVCYNCQLSTVVELLFSVPQGSILGTLLFLLYTAELFAIISSAGLVGHSYANDTQVYISAPAASASVSTQRFISCVERTDAWMRSNRLRMNADKTQLVWLGTRQQLDKLAITELPLLSASVKPSSTVLDLGVNIDGCSPWLTTSPRYAGRACFNYATYG